MRVDNTHHLARATARRQADARARVMTVLQEAHSLGEPLNLATAARRAAVSRAYLYSQPDLVAAIRDLAAANAGREPAMPTAQRSTPASLLARIEALSARNKKLREENQRLRKQLAAAHGALRDQSLTIAP